MPLRDIKSGRQTGRQTGAKPDVARKQFILIAMILILIASGLALYLLSEKNKVLLDPTSLCRTDTAPAEIVAVLLDASDTLSEPQVLRIANEMQRVANSIPRWGQIDIYLVARSGERLPEKIESICNPGTEADVNSLYQNPGLAKRRWMEFSNRFQDVTRDAAALADAETSPIFESIQSIALKTFDHPALDGVPKRLILISDLLQYVPGKTNHYRAVPSFAEFEGSAYFNQVRADLKSVSTTVFYLRRTGASPQGYNHVVFWTEYLKAQGASLTAIESVYGDQ
jgi:hypothetical protein